MHDHLTGTSTVTLSEARLPEHDPAFLDFLEARLSEEREAARERAGADGDTRGLSFVEDLLERLRRGEAPDRMSCDLLVAAYSRHPDFRRSWNRWLH